jgi:hypothetical protein
LQLCGRRALAPKGLRAAEIPGLLGKGRGFDRCVCIRSAFSRPTLGARDGTSRSVESRMGAVAWAMRQRSVSHPRSSNRTCGFPASGSPTGFVLRHTKQITDRKRLRAGVRKPAQQRKCPSAPPPEGPFTEVLRTTFARGEFPKNQSSAKVAPNSSSFMRAKSYRG